MATFGKTTQGTLSDGFPPNYSYVTKYQLFEEADVTAIYADMQSYSGSATAIAVIYNGSGDLVYASSPITVSETRQFWQIPVSLHLAPGVYYLGVLCGSGIALYLYFDATGGESIVSWLNEYPNPVPNILNAIGTTDASMFAIYAEYTAGAVNPLTIAISPSTPQSIATGNSVTFTATPSGGIPPYISIAWYVDGVFQANGNTFVFQPASAGNYNVYAVVTDTVETTANSATVPVTVTDYIPTLTVTISPSTPQSIPNGGSVTFTANASGGIAPYSFDWYVDGVLVDTTPSFTFTSANAGTYNIYAVATDSASTTAQSSPTSVTVAGTELAWFGNKVQGTIADGFPSNYLYATKFTLADEADIQAIYADIHGAGAPTDAVAVVYDNAGKVVYVSNPLNIDVTRGWKRFPVTLHLSPSNYYLSVLSGTLSPTLYMYATSATGGESVVNYYNNYPVPVSDLLDLGITDTSIFAIYAEYIVGVAPTRTLSVVQSANGTVTANLPDGTYPLGTSVTVTAVPDANYGLYEITVNGTRVSTTSPYTFALNNDSVVSASFIEQVTYTCPYGDNRVFNSQAELDSHILAEHTTPVSMAVEIGASYRVEVPPSVLDNGTAYNFQNWTDEPSNTNPTRVVTIPETGGEIEINAHYMTGAVTQYTLSIQPTTGGTTTPSDSQVYDEGTVVPVTANPDANYEVTDWLLDGVSQGNANPINVLMDADHTLQPVFTYVTPQYTLSVSSNVAGGPSGTQTVPEGTVLTVTATVVSGQTFEQWLLDGVDAGSATSIDVLMNANHTLRALYSPTQVNYNLTISTALGGTTNPSAGTTTHPVGTIVAVSAIPEAGSKFDNWILDGTPDGTSNPINLTMNSDHTLTPVFSKTTIALNVVAEIGGTVSPSGQGLPLTVGVSYQFFATEGTGYDFLNWDLAGANKGSDKTLVLQITADMDGQTLTAKFTTEPPPQVTVTLAVMGNGNIDIGTGAKTFNVGDTVTMTAIPRAGEAFVDWKMNGTVYTDNPLSLTITLEMAGKTLTADFTTLIQAGFPIWVIPVGLIILIGGYAVSRKGKKPRG